MKKSALIGLTVLLCFLAACQDQPQNGEPSTHAQIPAETTVHTEPTEPPPPSWLPQEEPALSYEEYFSQDRQYDADSQIWLIREQDVWKGYRLRIDGNGLHVYTYDAVSRNEADGTRLYTTPTSKDLYEYEVLGTNGVWACCLKDGETESIILVDILSGEREEIVRDELITNAGICDQVLYYAVHLDGQMQIVRRYLPTGDELVIPTGETVVPMFQMGAPASSLGDISWSCINPPMQEALEAALRDPVSKYQRDPTRPYQEQGGMDLSFLWQEQDVLVNASVKHLQWICYWIQQDTGIRSLHRVSYNILTNEKTETTGVIDNCWFGSGYAHDHYDPDAPALDTPAGSVGQWQPFAEDQSAEDTQALEGGIVLHNDYLYHVIDNTFIRLVHEPVSYYKLIEEQSGDKWVTKAIYAITQDNELVRVYLDGREPAVLYKGSGRLYQLTYWGDMLYVIDGDSILQLDTQLQQYRMLMVQEHLVELSCFGDSDGPDVLCIAVSKGLYYQQYLYNFVTGEIEETFRL